MSLATLGSAFEILGAGLQPFVEGPMRKVHGDRWEKACKSGPSTANEAPSRDVAMLLNALQSHWPEFQSSLRAVARGYVSELRDVRNRWAHQDVLSFSDIDRALDTIRRLLTAINAKEQVAALDVLVGSRPRGVNGLVKIGLSGPDGDYREDPLDYEHARKEGNDILLKCYDRTGRVMHIKINVDVILEAAFGDVSPDHGMFPEEDRT
jgi:hypothetical protein